MSVTIPGAVAGVVRNGVVFVGEALPEGTAVGVVAARVAVPKQQRTFVDADGNAIAMTPKELVEFEAWERLADESWATIDWGEGEIAREEG